MIRFSAGLVVVAIGVLIGGVATSKLSLVYVAIAVSAVALIVLAIGVALKREELFGGAPKPAPEGAGSGALAVAAAEVGHVANLRHGRDSSDGHAAEGQDKARKRVPGPATAAFEAAEAAAAARAAAPDAAPTVAPATVAPQPAGVVAGNPPLEQRRPAFGQAQAAVADTVADWQTRSPQSPQSPWTTGDQRRPSWTPAPREQAPAVAPQATVAASAPAAPAPPAKPAPAPSAKPAPAAAPTRPAAAPAPSAAPGWFDRRNQAADVAATKASGSSTAEPPREEPPTVARPTIQPARDEAAPKPDDEPSKDEPSEDEQPTAGASDVDLDDEDWPTRYSWLEDDDSADAESQPDAEAGTEPEQADAAESEAPDTVAAPQQPYAEADSGAEGADDVGPTAGADETAPAAAITADEPPATPGGDARLVTIIPGVPRYHDPDCILIRFMDEADIARKSIPEAEAANCTPCAACLSEG